MFCEISKSCRKSSFHTIALLDGLKVQVGHKKIVPRCAGPIRSAGTKKTFPALPFFRTAHVEEDGNAFWISACECACIVHVLCNPFFFHWNYVLNLEVKVNLMTMTSWQEVLIWMILGSFSYLQWKTFCLCSVNSNVAASNEMASDWGIQKLADPYWQARK